MEKEERSWDEIGIYQELSAEFIREFKREEATEDPNWKKISRFQKFMDKFVDKFNKNEGE